MTAPHTPDETGAAQRARHVLAPLEGGPLDEAESLYLDLHRHPELSHQEERTAAVAAERLEKAGFDVVTGIGGHGVAGVLRNGDGPAVMLRADMDALPVRESTGLPYASTRRAVDDEGREVPVAHACGHDAHTSALLTAAALLSRGRTAWRGTLLAVAQPAEETGDGARAMLGDGLYRRLLKPDVALAQHVVPLPAGVVGHRSGPMMAASAALRVTVFGRGGHASAPQAAIDPVVIAAHVVTRLQTIVARETDPADCAVVSVGSLHAGTKANVIPETAELGVSIRCYDDALHERLLGAVRRVVDAEAAASGAPRPPEVEVLDHVPVNANSPAATDAVRAAHQAYFGEGRVIEMPMLAASEDFPHFGAAGAGVHYEGAPVPTVYWVVGATPAEAWESAPGATPQEKAARLPTNHSPQFAPDPRPTLRTASEAMVTAALSALASPAR
ncbi:MULTISPECIES: amidohydrolase [unclassified Streptomyces]|uniref:amidohydrolase n=1 Tax=unclassified Streptomyces TaxID=2593676 RepID=UPI0022B69AE8|nr:MULTISPECIES: amidohydrolase [unclassified Streptomyces]MCZ7416883.1 amidohydrolase [Streptomyces sp. WMMC897]MCZ7433300.1 amidohydrolase [Streptomyces sp. WMMC1477]